MDTSGEICEGEHCESMLSVDQIYLKLNKCQSGTFFGNWQFLKNGEETQVMQKNSTTIPPYIKLQIEIPGQLTKFLINFQVTCPLARVASTNLAGCSSTVDLCLHKFA